MKIIGRIVFWTREVAAEVLYGVSVVLENFLLRPVDDLQAKWTAHKDSIYWCPTQQSFESAKQGGFDVCCYRPELHQAAPDAR